MRKAGLEPARLRDGSTTYKGCLTTRLTKVDQDNVAQNWIVDSDTPRELPEGEREIESRLSRHDSITHCAAIIDINTHCETGGGLFVYFLHLSWLLSDL